MDGGRSWMTPRRTGRGCVGLALCLGGVLAAGAGCGHEAQIPIADIMPSPRPAPEPTGAFASAVEASKLAVEAVGSKDLYALSFSEARKTELMEKLEPAVAALKRSLNGPFAYQPELVGPDQEKPFHQGWIWVLRSLEWRSERAAKAGEDTILAGTAGLVVRFAARLAQGDASDASLGFAAAEKQMMMASARLSQMSAADLEGLGQAAQAAAEELPKAEVSLANELDRTKMEIQALQEAYKSGERFGSIVGGKSGSDSQNWLNGHRTRVNDFFQGFASEAAALSADYVKLAADGAEPGDPCDPKSPAWKDPATGKPRWRPWRDMTPRIMAGHAVYVDQRKQFLARCRMLALTAGIESRKQRRGRAPADLSRMPSSLRTDPYSGKEFSYRSGGLQYRLWSTGPDRIDDGGLVETGPLARDFGLLTEPSQ